ncbi:MAG: hypothetical protein IKW12_04585 [Clostridia bacterium]|nr:hypothetical protein [Clostridia bacterium]
MKRFLCLSLAFLLFLSGCVGQNADNNHTKSDLNGAPKNIRFTINELKEIKSAFDSMNETDFMTYIEKEKPIHYSGGLYDYEKASDLLQELFSTSTVLFDNNTESLESISFYWERNSVHQLISFGDDKKVSAMIDTPESTGTKELQLGDNTVYLYEKEINGKNYSATLYETENTDYKFFANVITENSHIVLRSHNIQSFDDFENGFLKLRFVKIGDLLDELSTVSTESDANLIHR